MNNSFLKIQINLYNQEITAAPSTVSRSADGIIICYDITNVHSYNQVNFWNIERRHFNFKLPCYALVGLKLDLNHERCVSYEEALNWATEHNMTYYEVSSLTGENVKLLFNKFTTDIIMDRFLSIAHPACKPNESLILKVTKPTKLWYLNFTKIF